MSQINIGDTTLNFKDSAFTGDQWEQVASWVLNGGGESAAASAQIATEKASEAVKSAASANKDANSAKSYAVGGTGTREGEDTDNAKFYCQQAHAIAGEGMVFSVNGQQADKAGNVNVTKENIGLDKVNNTADTEKPVSLAQQQALDQLSLVLQKAIDQKAALLHASQHKKGGSDPLTPEDIGAEPAFEVLSFEKGGTGGSSVNEARANLGVCTAADIAPGASATFNLPGNGTFLFTSSSNAAKLATLFQIAGANNTPLCTDLSTPQKLSYTVEGSAITISNSSNYTCVICVVSFRTGSMYTGG